MNAPRRNLELTWKTRRERYGETGQTRETRVCRTCQHEKPLREFWPNSSGGIQTECKTCMKRRNSAWHRANAEKIRTRTRLATNKSRRKNFEKFLLRSVRSRAKKAGLECIITPADIVIPEFCPILGIKLARNTGWNRGHGLEVRDRSPSIDRIDNSKGYTPDNIIIVSYRANRIKSDASVQELRKLADFYEHIDRRRAEAAWASRMLPADVYGDQSVQVPRVQPPETEEVRQMSFGEI